MIVHEPEFRPGPYMSSRLRTGSIKESKALLNTTNTNTTQVLIIGAGISGLEAARLLQQKGIKTLVLEARNRSGGRIWSVRSKTGHMLDIGATWIHGIDGSIPTGFLTNPVWDLTQKAEIPTRLTQLDDIYTSYPLNDNVSDIHTWFDEYIDFVRDNTRDSPANISLEYYANLFAIHKRFTVKERYAFYSYLHHAIENNEGADLDTIGAKNFVDVTSSHYGDEHIFHKTGFMALTDYLAKDVVDIRFNQIVTRIAYNDKLVEVTTGNGQLYRAQFVLLTVPLGVLKAKQIEFRPQLPQWKLDAIDRIGFNNFEKVFLIWDRAWWNSTNFYFMRVSPSPIKFGYWANANKWNDRPALICFFAGKAAIQLASQQNQTALIEDIRLTLQEMFPDTVVPPPVETYITRWNQDPFSYGSYAYISVKQKHEDPSYLAEPIAQRLLFAGEATNVDSYGYAHGALLSARREVTRLLFVYNLLPIQNQITSRSTSITPFAILLIIQFICLHLRFY